VTHDGTTVSGTSLATESFAVALSIGLGGW
jgi:hypothetical protein